MKELLLSKDIELKIYSADNPNIDYMPWVLEKLEYLIKDLLKTSLDDENIVSALSEAIKIYSLCTGKNAVYNDKEIYRFILDNGVDGFDYVRYCLGITSEKGKLATQLQQQIEDNETMEKIKSLITPDKANRTLIYDLLRQIHQTNEWTDSIFVDADEVSNGNKTWDWFYNKHKDDDINKYLFDICETPQSLKR